MTDPKPAADSWTQAMQLIDELVADAAQSKMTIAALVREIGVLRQAVADRDGRINHLYGQIVAAGGGVR